MYEIPKELPEWLKLASFEGTLTRTDMAGLFKCPEEVVPLIGIPTKIAETATRRNTDARYGRNFHRTLDRGTRYEVSAVVKHINHYNKRR